MLLQRIETHLALKGASPGFHLSDEDFASIRDALRTAHTRPSESGEEDSVQKENSTHKGQSSGTSATASEFNAEQINELVEAMVQLLDDMGPTNNCCACLAAKAQARIAIEPFLTDDHAPEDLMPLALAKRIENEAGQ